MKRLSFLVVAIALLVLPTQTALSQTRTAHSQVGLVSEVKSVAEGKSFDIALNIHPDRGWHIYWTNPGDAGRAPRINWELPEGFEVGELQYPAPHFVPFMGEISYGYDGNTFFLMKVSVPESFDGDVTLTAKANWLACDDEVCVPERADLELTLPKGDGSEYSVWHTDFVATRALHPIPIDWETTFYTTEDRVIVDIELPGGVPDLGEVWLYPGAEKMIDHAMPQELSMSESGLRFEMVAGFKAPEIDETMVVLSSSTDVEHPQSFELMATRVDSLKERTFEKSATVKPGEDFPPALASAGSGGGTSGGSGGGGTSVAPFAIGEFFKILAFAFLGGLILNVMPCVLPILSLKALAVADLSGQDANAARIAGLSYFAGVLVCFAILAILILALRAGGSLVGWAFHLQNPTIILVLALLVTAVGLNFSGVFEIRGSFANLGGLTDKLTRMGGSEFFTGLLAVIIASPCTVPFMGAAIGYAVVQPVVISLAIFAGLAIGFALPYLAVTMFPPVRALLPKPGAWMETMRRILAFPMYATAIWLLWILGGQTGVNNLTIALLLILLLSFVLWCWGRALVSRGFMWRSISGVGALALVAIIVWPQSEQSAEAVMVDEKDWSVATLEELHGDGQAVFAYFTADWCVTCKVNEGVTLHAQKMQVYLLDNEIQVLVGDWTTEDEAITVELAKHGRAGVPLYLYYKPGGDIDNPVILPQLLNHDMVVDMIEQA